MKASTSITVSPITLKYVNKIKSLYEYISGRKYSLDEAILGMCLNIDYEMSLRWNLIPPDKDLETFQLEQLTMLADMLDLDQEIEKLIEKGTLPGTALQQFYEKKKNSQ